MYLSLKEVDKVLGVLTLSVFFNEALWQQVFNNLPRFPWENDAGNGKHQLGNQEDRQAPEVLSRKGTITRGLSTIISKLNLILSSKSPSGLFLSRHKENITNNNKNNSINSLPTSAGRGSHAEPLRILRRTRWKWRCRVPPLLPTDPWLWCRLSQQTWGHASPGLWTPLHTALWPTPASQTTAGRQKIFTWCSWI